VAAYKKWYRETHRDLIAESKKRYRERHRARVAEANKRYKERYPDRVAEAQRRYDEARRERYTTDKYSAYRRQYHAKKRKRAQEKMRTREKLNALGPLKLTISLTDYLKSPSGCTPVTTYVKAFCDSLESVDTNESPPENDSHTLIDLDSGAIHVMEPPECDLDDLSFLQDLLEGMSPYDWQQVMDDVEDLDLEPLVPLVPPEGIIDLLEDMSSDEGIDLLYDLVT